MTEKTCTCDRPCLCGWRLVAWLGEVIIVRPPDKPVPDVGKDEE